MTYELKDKVVIITGGAIGIGGNTVEVLVRERVKHVAVLDILENEGVALQNKLNNIYGADKVKFISCDVTDDNQLYSAYKSVIDEHKYIDIVINNAGIMNDSLEMYRREIQINMTAVITSTLKAMEIMGKDKGGTGGTVINIASAVVFAPYHVVPIYTATKQAVLTFSNCIGMPETFTKTGVRVIAMCFGLTGTSIVMDHKFDTLDGDKEVVLRHIEGQPIQKITSAAEAILKAYRCGESGSTWLSFEDKPAQDVTGTIKKSQEILLQLLNQ